MITSKANLKRWVIVGVFCFLFLIITGLVYATRSPVLFFKFDEGSGSTAIDATGNGNTATLYNSPTYISGGGLNFNGTNQYVRTNSAVTGSLGVDDQPYTIAARVRVAEGETNGGIVHVADGSNGIGWCIPMLGVYDGKFRALSWQATFPVTATAPTTLTAGQWYDIAHVWDDVNDLLKLYVDGELVASTNMSSFDAAGTGVYMFIGMSVSSCAGDTGYFAGDIKDVKIDASALTDDEVASLWDPTVESLSPVDNATSVAISEDLVITFDQIVDVESGNITIKKTSDDSTVETIDVTSDQVSGSGTTEITITPSNNFDDDTEYYVLIDDTVFDDEDGHSYAGISSTTAWSFTTVDLTNPTLSTFSPADNATNVSASANLVITFDEAVNVGSGTISIKKVADDVLVMDPIDVTSGVVSGDGTNTITINPSRNLFPGTEYYIQIDATAFDDLAGNSYVGISDNTSWTFTTASATTPSERFTITPSVVSVDEGRSGVVTFSLEEPLITDKEEGLRIYIISSDTDYMYLSDNSLEWETDADWATPQSFTIYTVDDEVLGDKSLLVQWFAVANDEFYTGASGTIPVTIRDDDASSLGYIPPPTCQVTASPSIITSSEAVRLNIEETSRGKTGLYYILLENTHAHFPSGTDSITVSPSRTTTYSIAFVGTFGAEFCQTTVEVLDEQIMNTVEENNENSTENVFEEAESNVAQENFQEEVNQKTCPTLRSLGGTLVRKGGRGDLVKYIQELINSFRQTETPLIVDGIAGTKTDAGIRDVQRGLGVDVDGLWGNQTHNAYQAWLTAQCQKN